MSISRRSLLKVAGMGAALAAIDLGDRSAANAVTGSPVTTLDGTVQVGPAGDGGYRRLSLDYGPGEPHLLRNEFNANPTTVTRPLTAFAQMTDLHIVDDQSPLRTEFLDRWADDGPPHFNNLPTSAAYRAHESMSTQVVDAMCRAIQRVGHGPRTGLPLAFTMVTGDAVDNCHYNEVRWYIDLLDGQAIVPSSGNSFDHSVTGDALGLDIHYWHPASRQFELENTNGPGLDLNFQAGFPEVLALPGAARRSFTAHGLGMPWYSAFGNHDALVQGNVPINNGLVDLAFNVRSFATGGFKPSAIPGLPDRVEDVSDVLGVFEQVVFGSLPGVNVPADANRRLLSHREFIQEHFVTAGAPVGHGFTSGVDRAYYVVPGGPQDLVCHVVLDTTYVNGGADGWLDDAQFRWLEGVLRANSSRYISGDPETSPESHLILNPGAPDKLIVIYSHHTSSTMGNSLASLFETNAHNGSDLRKLLLRYPNVVLWVNGHNHKNQIVSHSRQYVTVGGFWEVTTASHIDWPYQSRIIEIGEGSGTVSIFTTMVDIDAPLDWRGGDIHDPATLASLSRELAANDLQQRNHGVLSRPGTELDRNTQLLVPTPFIMPPSLPGRNTTPITAVPTTSDRMDIFAVANDGRAMTNTWLSLNGWQGWTHISNGFPSAGGAGSPVTAARRFGEHLDAFTVGGDNHVWWSWSDQRGAWSAWTKVGSLTCRPGSAVNVAVRDTNNMQLVTTASDGRIMTIGWNSGVGWTSDWYQLANGGAQPGSTVTIVSRYSAHLDAFAVGGDNHVWSSWWDVSTGVWSTWFKIGTLTCRAGSTVTVVARDSNHLDLFTTGADNRVMSSYWNPTTGWASDWFAVLGGGAVSPGSIVNAISRYPNHLDVFTVDSFNNVTSAYWDAATGWGGWFTLDKANPGGQVTATSTNLNRIDLFTVGGPRAGTRQVDQVQGFVDTTWWTANTGWSDIWTPVRGG